MSAKPSFFQKGYKPVAKVSQQQGENSEKKASPQWIEKYRPKMLKDVVSQEEIVAMLFKCVKTVDKQTGQVELPNLLMYGPPGTGKTSSALALARELFGAEYLQARVLELNASDERGIDMIRNKIKGFAQRTVKTGGLKKIPEHNRIPAALKLIILDECDSMTRPAQEALRRTMEKYSQTTRFILIANYVTKIIGPIASRCAKLRFKNLGLEEKQQRLKSIAEKENISISEEALEELICVAKGDLRRCVNYLQSAVNVIGEEDEKTVLPKHVSLVTVQVPVKAVEKVFESALDKTTKYDKLKQDIEELSYDAYMCSDILNVLLKIVLTSENLSNLQKAHIMDKIGETDGMLIDGADEWLQLLNVLHLSNKYKLLYLTLKLFSKNTRTEK